MTSSGWTRPRRCEYRQTTVQEPWGATEPRYFTGEVLASNDSVIKLRGYSHLRDLSTGHFARKGEIRTKVISVISGTHILYELPSDASVDSMQIRSVGGKVELRGDGEFRMDLTEYSVHHP